MGRRRTRSGLVCALVATLGLGAGAAAPASARAAPGPAPHTAAGTPATRLAPVRRVHVTLALRPRDPAALAAYARAVSTPGSPQYGRYLTPRQFGRRFGAGAARIRAVTAALRARGLRVGRASVGGLSIGLTARTREGAGALARGVSVALGVPSGRAARPREPAVVASARRHSAAARAVQSVIGLDGSAGAHPLAVRASRPGGTPATGTGPRTAGAGPRTTAAGPQPCPAAAAAAPGQSAYTDNAIAAAYGFDALYAAGETGAGTTVAVYELEPNDPSDIAAFQSCYGTHAAISYVRVDGGAGVGAGSDEAAFDIENLIAFAPGARLLVYQGPNSNSGLPGSGPYDTFSAIVNQDRAQVISVSWGQCEAQLGRPAATAEGTLFLQAAVQGQSIVAAAGDNGAQDCQTGGAHSSTRPAVDDPAAQPGVTGVGGTTLLTPSDPPRETAWNSGAGLRPGAAPGAGGGGISSLWPMGADQLDAPARLHVRSPFAAGPACGQSAGFCREVPDVAADADPSTGYEIYWNGADTVPEPSGWQGLGGTSGAAPLWAALLAIADASPACDGTPLGFAGPALYRAAADHYGADFHDVVSGNDDFTHTNGGRWAAGRGYDLATGLGTPNAAPLVATLCADGLRFGGLADQSSAVRATVGLRLHASVVRGGRLTYAASHLPPGIALDPSSGLLSGRPRTPGRYAVIARVRDGEGARAAERFTWSVGGAPRLSPARLVGAGRRRRLVVSVSAGTHAPPIRELAITLPASVRAAGPATVAAGPSVQPTVRASRSLVTIALSAGSPVVRATIQVVAVGRPRGAHAVRPPTRLAVAVQSGSTGTSSLTAALRGGT